MLKKMLVLSTERGVAFPAHSTGQYADVVHFIMPFMGLLVTCFLLYSVYVIRTPIKCSTEEQSSPIDTVKAWALFLKFDRRGVLALNFDDLTCFMGIICPDLRWLGDWNEQYYDTMCVHIGAEPRHGISFSHFVAMYNTHIGTCDEHYDAVFKKHQTEKINNLIVEDPVENITAPAFAKMDTQCRGTCSHNQFIDCFRMCCGHLGITEPTEDWFSMAFSSFDQDDDQLLSYIEFHHIVQQYYENTS